MLTILPHLGLGDQIICSGLIRARFPTEKFQLIGREKHTASLLGLYHGMPNFNLVQVQDDDLAQVYFQRHSNRIGLGCWCEHTHFDASHFVEEFARQLDVDVDESWRSFTPNRENPPPLLTHRAYVYLHDDQARGYEIDRDTLLSQEDPTKRDTELVEPEEAKGRNICSAIEHIIHAISVHVIDSCFLNLIDRIKEPMTDRLYLHAYAKPNPNLPLLKKKWTVLK